MEWGVGMAAKSSDLLQQASKVEELCSALLALPDPLNERQQEAIREVTQALNLFTARVVDLADIIENHLDQIHSLSHRLRTPLVTIQGYPEMLLMGLYGTLTAPQENIAEQLDSAASQLSVLVTELFQSTTH